jgi:hypothetical protein
VASSKLRSYGRAVKRHYFGKGKFFVLSNAGFVIVLFHDEIGQRGDVVELVVCIQWLFRMEEG